MSNVKKSDVFVYIAGKYTDKTMLNTELNIIEAQKLAIKCAEHGIKYFCPHMHSRLMNYYVPDVPWEYWMDSCIDTITKLCTSMIMVHNYTTSKGSILEEEHAMGLGLPVFYDFEVLKGWYDLLED